MAYWVTSGGVADTGVGVAEGAGATTGLGEDDALGTVVEVEPGDWVVGGGAVVVWSDGEGLDVQAAIAIKAASTITISESLVILPNTFSI